MDLALFTLFSVAYAVLVAWLVLLGRAHGWFAPSMLLVTVCLALVYDNGVLALGSTIGEGQALEALNRARYWLHGLVTPWLVVVAWDAARRAGARWAGRSSAAVAAVVLSLALVVYELAAEVVDLGLRPVREHGVLRYGDVGTSSGPPLMVLVVAVVLVGCGLAVWKASGWPWMAVGAVVMTVGSAVPVPVDSGAVTNAFELALLLSLVATKHHQDGGSARRSR